MKRLFVRALCALLCLCLTAPLCVSCRFVGAEFTLPAAAETPLAPLEAYLSEALSCETEMIDLTAYHVTEEEVHAVYSSLYATDPSLFFVKANYGISKNERGEVSYLRPAYSLTDAARVSAAEDFHARVETIIAPIRALTPLEQVAYLHDYLILHYSYDTSYTVYDAYTLLTTGRGVCQAYALLFTALARALGIPAACVTCFDRSHEWNAVLLNGEWYHIDLIWDSSDTPGEVYHTYFLIGDEELRARRALQDPLWDTAYTWDAPGKAHGIRTLSAPWRRENAAPLPFFLPGNGTLLFTSSGGTYRVLSDLTCTPVS